MFGDRLAVVNVDALKKGCNHSLSTCRYISMYQRGNMNKPKLARARRISTSFCETNASALNTFRTRDYKIFNKTDD